MKNKNEEIIIKIYFAFVITSYFAYFEINNHKCKIYTFLNSIFLPGGL